MKRIAFFSGDITRSGGTERAATLIANALEARGDYEVHMVSLTHGRQQMAFPLSGSIRRTALSQHWITPGAGYLPVIGKLKKYVKKNDIGLLIDIDGVLDAISLPVKWLTGVRVISWEHFHYYYFKNKGIFYRSVIRRLSVRFADAVVLLTERDRDFYEKHLHIRHRIRVIHNPADYLPGRPAGKVRAFEKKVLLSAGGLMPAKGFVKIPMIAHALKTRYPSLDFTWRIAGEGVQRGKIEQEIGAYGVSERVKLLGQVSEVEKLYDEALVYVMTSEREGLPMVLLEARQYGLPIVSFDILTGPSEVIRDGVNGYLIPVTGDTGRDAQAMADAIGRLLTDETLYRSFACHAKDHMEDFALERIVGQWEELIAEVLPEHA